LCCSIVVSVTANTSTIHNGNHVKFILPKTMVRDNPLTWKICVETGRAVDAQKKSFEGREADIRAELDKTRARRIKFTKKFKDVQRLRMGGIVLTYVSSVVGTRGSSDRCRYLH
jgi:hypothetical protein